MSSRRAKNRLSYVVAISCVLVAALGIGLVASLHGHGPKHRRRGAAAAFRRLAVGPGTTTSPSSTAPPTTAASPAAPSTTTAPATPGTVGGTASTPNVTTRPSTAHRSTVAPSTPAPTTPAPAAAAAPPAPPATPFLQGAYVGPANRSGMSGFAAATGSRPTIASEYLPPSTGWAGMDGAGGSLSWMFASGWSGSGYTLSIGVPIIPTDTNGNPVGSLATGATGAYNGYFVTLAQTLIAAGESNAYLRLGWEFDDGVYAWSATTPADEASYAAYFQQIVTAMRSVRGEAFRFVWNPDASAFIASGYSVQAAYPGSAYVNVIGLDAYDESWATPQTPAATWAQALYPEFTDALGFAQAQGRPLAFCEWGLAIGAGGHGLGDDPLFVNNMVAWMKNPGDDVAYESYFDFNSDGTNSQITGGAFPASLGTFKYDLG